PRLGLVDLTLLRVQGRIGAAEIGLSADEFGHARAGAAGCVVEGESRARRLVGGHEPGDGVGLRGRATRLESLLASAVDGGLYIARSSSAWRRCSGAALVLVAAAGRKQQGPSGQNAHRSADSVVLHVAPLIVRDDGRDRRPEFGQAT